MDYKKYGQTYYVRIDKGEEIVKSLLSICEREKIKSATVLYTAEIELRPVTDGVILRKPDPETGTGFWSFYD